MPISNSEFRKVTFVIWQEKNCAQNRILQNSGANLTYATWRVFLVNFHNYVSKRVVSSKSNQNVKSKIRDIFWFCVYHKLPSVCRSRICKTAKNISKTAKCLVFISFSVHKNLHRSRRPLDSNFETPCCLFLTEVTDSNHFNLLWFLRV